MECGTICILSLYSPNIAELDKQKESQHVLEHRSFRNVFQNMHISSFEHTAVVIQNRQLRIFKLLGRSSLYW